MTRGAVELGMWTLAIVMAVTGTLAWNRGAQPPQHRSRPPVPGIGAASAVDVAALKRAADTVIRRDPFRIARRPAAIAFGAEPAPSAPEPPRTERPRLRLAGIIGGPPWEAILEGAPGRPAGVLVRRGDVVGDLRIRRITRDTVVVQSADTTWRLTFQRTSSE